MEMHSVDSTELRENKQDPEAKFYPQWELNPGPLDLMSSMLLSDIPKSPKVQKHRLFNALKFFQQIGN